MPDAAEPAGAGKPTTLGILVGSLRRDSLTRKVATAAMARTPAGTDCRLLTIGDMPHYDADLEGDAPPAAWVRFRQEAATCDGFVIFTPEYNRSLPGVLKNAIDVGSRPPAASIWRGKAAAVGGVTPNRQGAFGAVLAVRQALIFLDMPTMQQPELYLSGADRIFDAQGRLTDADVNTLLDDFMTAAVAWVKRIRDTA